MASTVWKGYISFGLVSVPIRLFAAARDTHISFHQVHKECGTRVKQQLFCPYDNRVVQRNELAKGYPIDKNTNILIEDSELKELVPQSSEVMEIVQFVKMSELDPIYFETSYYSVPEEPGKRAYALLLKAMQEKNVAAVAKITLHQHERIVTIRPYDNGLTLHTLYYAEEVREVAEYGQDAGTAVQPKELALAEQFVESLTQPYDASEFKDTYEEKVMQLIESKGEGKASPAPADKPHMAPVIDLMEALKRSMERGKPAAAAGLQIVPDEKKGDGSKKKPPSTVGVAEEAAAKPTRKRKAS